MTPTQQLLSDNLKAIRKEKGLSQVSISEKSGVIASTYSRIESCQVFPNLATLEKLAEAMEVPIADFFKTEKTIERSIVEKLELLNSLSEYNRNVIEIMIDAILEKDKLEVIQQVKMKKRLIELEHIRNTEEI